ncbi:hypothetical protein GGI15_004336 [Coemansia interrupta]|uniref:Programmed cell death protein 5 n=1 Tax=Coemansia interrupta TaxID=1126814 RepID=A0A9W8LG97_9FUNG|nr:hypothetical protein GGI15_004336 [Coemansia interrupta]
MADSELEAIRARRMAELQAQQGGQGAGLGGNSAESGDKSQQDEIRATILAQALDNMARERLGRIAMVKPDRARAIENMIIRMAQARQLRGKITEDDLKDMLKKISAQNDQSTKIVVNRKTYDDSESEDEYDL